MKTHFLKISGVHCEACIKLIKMELKDKQGIDGCEIDFKSGLARITTDDNIPAAKLIDSIKAIGYAAEEYSDTVSAAPVRKSLFSSRGASSKKVLLFLGAVIITGFAVTMATGNWELPGSASGQNAASLTGEALSPTDDAATCAIDDTAADCLTTPSITPLSERKSVITPPNDSAGSAGAETDFQTVRMTQAAFGYEPNEFTIKKGVPVKWIITSETSRSCAASIRMDDYNILQNLEEGENVIEFTPTKTGKVDFSCGMGMYTGQFNVID